jgi:prepilin-type N-terminal cleavage/methylation domain-containing protein
MRHAHCLPRRRNAFTLIELLVVMILILVIAALGLGYIVFGQDNQHSVNGAQTITGALLNAKQRARRDGLPTGVRIIFTSGTDVNGNSFNFGTQLQLIQEPGPYNTGTWSSGTGTNASPLGFSTNVDFQGGAAYAGEIDESTVQAGDYFVAGGTTTPHLITKVIDATHLLLFSPASSAPPAAGSSYTIFRAPRRLPSEDTIQMPSNIVIDNSAVPGAVVGSPPNYCQNIPTRGLIDSSHLAPGVPVSEIVFALSGAVVGQGTGADKVYLWLRDSSLKLRPVANSVAPGAPLLLSVQIRTGLIGVYPVAPWLVGSSTSDPYAFVKDPRSSGL